MTTTSTTVTVIGGVDTHKHTHYAAVIDEQRSPARSSGVPRHRPRLSAQLLAWMRGHGQLDAIGVESTGSFGAALTRCAHHGRERV